MKPVTSIVMSFVLMNATASAGWFDGKAQLIAELRDQIKLQKTSLTIWQFSTVALSAGSVIALAVGTALGSKRRKDGER